MSKKKKDDPGIYIIKLTKPAFGLPAGRIYIGKGDDVEDRLNKELGKTSGHATFFRSIGLLLGKTVIPRSGKKDTGYNFKFYERQEIADWLEEYTEHTIIRCDWRNEEERLIRKHKPPINIQHNKEHCLPKLEELRKKAHAIARK